MTTGTGPAVSVEGLVKTYDERRVVDGISFEVAPGECFALLGPNGAGKTTTLEILQGFRSRDAGDVRVLGVDPATGHRDWRVRVGVVAQSTPRGLELTAGEMLDHFARYHADPRPTAELLDAVELTGSAGVRVPRLSGGQRRRLEVALGIQGRPELLFLDEPTTGLDPEARRGFWTLVEQLRADGTTVLLTTHYLDEADRLADRVGVIADGSLVRLATPDRLGDGMDLPTVVSCRVDGEPVRFAVADPVPALRELLADHPGACLTHLDVRRPGLEEVYLALTGAPGPDRPEAPGGPPPDGRDPRDEAAGTVARAGADRAVAR